MTFWIWLWKAVFLVTLTGFSLMAVWVSIQGARDIKPLLEVLRGRHDKSEKP